MLFQNVIFFSDLNIKSNYSILKDSLLSHNINLFFLKEEEKPFLPSGIKLSNCLLVTDTIAGSIFAKENHIPFIAQDATDAAIQEAVCLFDSFDSLSFSYLNEQWRRAHHLPLTIASTEHFTLRELTLDDIPNLYEIYQNPAISRFLPQSSSLNEELVKHNDYIKYCYEFFGYGLWGIFDNKQHLIGQAGLQNVSIDEISNSSFHFNPNDCIIELSYMIDKPFQGNGYAREAINEIYQFALVKLELSTLYCFIAKQNLASIKTAMDMGMNKVGTCHYKGLECNIYRIDDIASWLTTYIAQSKFRENSVSLWKKAQLKPVQKVYKKIYNKIDKPTSAS